MRLSTSFGPWRFAQLIRVFAFKGSFALGQIGIAEVFVGLIIVAQGSDHEFATTRHGGRNVERWQVDHDRSRFPPLWPQPTIDEFRRPENFRGKPRRQTISRLLVEPTRLFDQQPKAREIDNHHRQDQGHGSHHRCCSAFVHSKIVDYRRAKGKRLDGLAKERNPASQPLCQLLSQTPPLPANSKCQSPVANSVRR